MADRTEHNIVSYIDYAVEGAHDARNLMASKGEDRFLFTTRAAVAQCGRPIETEI